MGILLNEYVRGLVCTVESYTPREYDMGIITIASNVGVLLFNIDVFSSRFSLKSKRT